MSRPSLAPHRPAPVVPGPHLTGPFAPVVDEVDVADLEVVGELPVDLDGAYVRNGPNPRFSPIGSYVYPLDGDGMLHRITLREGRARYDNRFVRTPMVLTEERAGHAIWPGGSTSAWRPGADEVGAALAGSDRQLPDINVVRHHGTLLALAESDVPYRMGPQLETLGDETFGDTVPAGICAHPKIDPVTGEMLAFAYSSRAPYLTWTTIAPDGRATTPRPVPGVDRPSMIHDMAITTRHVVLVVAPLYFDLEAAVRGGAVMSWQPEQGTRIAVIPRDGGPVRWYSDEAFWLWHTVNAHDQGEGVVLDYVEWADPGIFDDGSPREPRLARLTLDPTTGRVRRRILTDLTVEFPRVDDRFLGRAHSVSASVLRTGRELPHPGCWDGLAWYRTDTGAVARWTPDDVALGEPSFAPDPRSDAADAGWWLVLGTRFSTNRSHLYVLPAADPAAGPVATVRMPVRVPLGLHGAWLPQ